MSSISSAEVITFLATTKPEDSRRFYENILGLQFVADEPSALVFDANATMLRISKVKEFNPAPFTVLGWSVSDILFEVAALEKKVTFERYDGVPQDERGICTYSDGTKVAWFKDPDGNTLSLTQFASP